MRNQYNYDMKQIAVTIIILLSGVTGFAQKRHVIKLLPRSEETDRASVHQVYNVYRREVADIIKYAQNFCKQENLEFTTNKDSAYVRSRIFYNYNGIKKTCLYKSKIYCDMYIYAKENRTKIEFTNITYEGESPCGHKGEVELLEECQCSGQSEFYTSLHQQILATAQDYHKFLKERTRSGDDW